MGRCIEAVIFDLGGTLIEYAGPYRHWPELETPGLQAAYESLRRHEIALPPFLRFREAAFAILPGRWQAATEGVRNLLLIDYLHEVLVDLQVEKVAPEWLAEAAERYQTAVCSQAAMIEEAPQTLARVKEQGYKIGLLSNTMFEGAAHVADLQRFNLDSYFDVMLFSADENKWKPGAAPYLHLLEQLQVEPDNAVFIGDSPVHDVVGGKEAGLHTIYFRSSERFDQSENYEPDATIHHLSELPAVLAGWADCK
jgi:HAD superfamily hydrolase (TIGR01662 family)